MHVIHLSEPVPLNKTVGTLGGGDWLVQDLNAFEIAQIAERGVVKVDSHGWVPWLSQEENAPTLIMRSGAYGDLLMLSPILHEWSLYTNQIPHLSCFKHHHCLFENFPVPIVLEEYPLPLAAVNKYREIITLESLMEKDATRHPTDIFFDALELKGPLRSRKPVYVATMGEQVATAKHLFTKRPNVAIQMRASIPNRDYPVMQWFDVITGLEKRGWGVLLLGVKGHIGPLPPPIQSPFIRNLAMEGLSFRESAAVLSQCDAFCGVDSAFMHLAAALDIPSVSLHGSFKWQTRAGSYGKNTAISGKGACAGCSWHAKGHMMFPPNKPCSQIGECVVLASIEPDRIVQTVDRLKPCASPSRS